MYVVAPAPLSDTVSAFAAVAVTPVSWTVGVVVLEFCAKVTGAEVVISAP